ncbi:MAG TPA: isoprenylcysteine carboxylmethyltransferase family protein [Anaerolineales bacterium]
MKSNTVVRIFLLIIGNALALLLALLALETTPKNFLGWFLFAISIAYGAGGVIYLWRNRDEESAKRSETGNRSFWWILPGFVVIFFAPPLEFLFLPALLPRGIAVELAGLVIILVGLAIRIWTRMTIGGMYSGYLRVKIGHVLVTDGPYRLIRHPGYTGFVIMALGLCIGYSSLIGLAAVPVLLLPGLAYRIKVEENLLTEQFGDEYQAYARRSKKLIPGVW